MDPLLIVLFGVFFAGMAFLIQSPLILLFAFGYWLLWQGWKN